MFFLLFEEVGYPVLLSYEPAKPGCAGTDLHVKEHAGQHKAQAAEERCRRTISSRGRYRFTITVRGASAQTAFGFFGGVATNNYITSLHS